MSLEIIRADIVDVDCDVIVNSANPEPTIGGGVDQAIYAAADADRMLADREKIGPLEAGEAEYTPAYGMKQKYVIHAVGPIWHGGTYNEEALLRKTYRRCLELTKELKAESVAFPVLSAGIFGYPKGEAIKTAVDEIGGFLLENELTVYLVVYNRKLFELSGKVFEGIKSYIDEADVVPPDYHRSRLSNNAESLNASGEAPEVFGSLSQDEGMLGKEMSGLLDDIIDQKEDTFQEQLFRIIDSKGLDDKDVYKRANIDRKHFSKIKSNPEYSPSKRTAVAFAVALGLDIDETNDLLTRAGFALSGSNLFDLIIRYCIENKIYDVNEVNMMLFNYEQQTLGA